MSLNRAMIIGNLTRNPELRTTPNGHSVTSFGVATNRVWTNKDGSRQEETQFHNIVAWGRLAEICNQYLVKGKKIYVDGRLQTREWEGQDGIKRQRTEVVAENMVMLDRGGSSASTGAAVAGAESEVPPPSVGGSDEEIKTEDIPF